MIMLYSINTFSIQHLQDIIVNISQSMRRLRYSIPTVFPLSDIYYYLLEAHQFFICNIT